MCVMVAELIDKYVFLLQTFAEAGGRGLSLEEISSRWESRYGEAYPRRSFINHRKAVEDIFGIVITCDRSTNRYMIDAADSAMDKRQAVEYLINTFTVNSLLTLGKERLSGRVAVEDVPSGARWLTTVMQAMLDGECLTIGYRKYLSHETEQREIRPYAVKEFEKRWYIVAFSEQAQSLRTYAMDRVVSLERSGKQFKMPLGFNVDELFEGSYGIYLPEDEKPVLIKLKATEREAAYLRDLPLHPSQMELDDGLFVVRLIPNPNFIMELCKRGEGLTVLEPVSLRQEVASHLKQAIQEYE